MGGKHGEVIVLLKPHPFCWGISQADTRWRFIDRPCPRTPRRNALHIARRRQGRSCWRFGYGSIPIDTFLVGWTSIYQLFWGSLGTKVLTHPHLSLLRTFQSVGHLIWGMGRKKSRGLESRRSMVWEDSQIQHIRYTFSIHIPDPQHAQHVWGTRPLVIWEVQHAPNSRPPCPSQVLAEICGLRMLDLGPLDFIHWEGGLALLF